MQCNEANIDLITFQFNKWGGSFVVELASCPSQGIISSWGEEIPSNKITAHNMDKRFRLGATSREEEGFCTTEYLKCTTKNHKLHQIDM
ncbi:DUF4304 domain-containing protein [Metabacillus idriensis]|uniref:DUF4304 domain-containing protein n=1 Tax=Metabacillus idriensis TaxID=324768 RepID=UPI001749CDF6|nr:DUF4304 domain-containing protein [Metabacillus idriensis]